MVMEMHTPQLASNRSIGKSEDSCHGWCRFIGSHVCERLLHDGHSVSILDDLNNFYSPAAKEANLEAIQRQGTCVF